MGEQMIKFKMLLCMSYRATLREAAEVRRDLTEVGLCINLLFYTTGQFTSLLTGYRHFKRKNRLFNDLCYLLFDAFPLPSCVTYHFMLFHSLSLQE